MIVFIGGPMEGIENNNKDAFMEAQKAQMGCGNIVLNMAMLPEGLDKEKIKQICMEMVNVSDGVYFLEGWKESDVATELMGHAFKTKKQIRYA